MIEDNLRFIKNLVFSTCFLKHNLLSMIIPNISRFKFYLDLVPLTDEMTPLQNASPVAIFNSSTASYVSRGRLAQWKTVCFVISSRLCQTVARILPNSKSFSSTNLFVKKCLTLRLRKMSEISQPRNQVNLGITVIDHPTSERKGNT